MKKGTLFRVKANRRINYFLAGVIFSARTTSHCSTQPIENTSRPAWHAAERSETARQRRLADSGNRLQDQSPCMSEYGNDTV